MRKEKETAAGEKLVLTSSGVTHGKTILRINTEMTSHKAGHQFAFEIGHVYDNA